MAKGKFHNGINGPAPCEADERPCKYDHFDDKAQAAKAWEDKLEKEHGDGTMKSKAEIKDAYEDAEAALFNFIASIKGLEGKMAKLIAQIKAADPADVPEAAYAKLEEYEEKTRLAHKKERKLFEAFKLAELEAFNTGIIEKVSVEDVFKARGTKWGDSLGIGYHSEMNVTLNPSDPNHFTKRRSESLVMEYAAWSGKSLYEARDRLNEIYAQSKKSNASFDQLVTKEFQDTAHDDKKKKRIFVDLETSSLDPYRGEIIEIGIVVTDSSGKVIQTYNERFGMENSEARDKLGTGAQHVHRIAPEDIKDKKPFSDPEVQKQMAKILNDPNSIVVPHNAGFEHGQLSTHLDGYYSTHVKDSSAALRQRKTQKDMGKPAVLTQDTRAISAYFLKSNKNTLEEFATANGVSAQEYKETAHGAYADADMTSRALAQFKENLRNMPEGQKYISPTYDGVKK